jgi:hypothetical protein
MSCCTCVNFLPGRSPSDRSCYNILQSVWTHSAKNLEVLNFGLRRERSVERFWIADTLLIQRSKNDLLHLRQFFARTIAIRSF